MFVFLEGATGAGKSTVTARLQQMGYSVHHENFIQLCQNNPDLPAHSLLLQTKWMADLIAALQRHVAAYQRQPESIKHGVVFFDRSPLTPAIYAVRDASLDAQCKSYLLQLSLQMFSCFRSTLLLCSADPYAVSLRRSHRLMQVVIAICIHHPSFISRRQKATPPASDMRWARQMRSCRMTLRTRKRVGVAIGPQSDSCCSISVLFLFYSVLFVLRNIA